MVYFYLIFTIVGLIDRYLLSYQYDRLSYSESAVVKMVLLKDFRSLKHRIMVATIVLISAWMMPAVAELNINNSQSVRLSENAKESQYFTDTVRLMENPKELELFVGIGIKQYIIDAEETDILKKYQDLGIAFGFATVEGSLFGDITGSVLSEVTVKDSSALTLSLPKYIDAKMANIPELTINNYGTPVNIARLSTLSNSSLLSRVGGAGIIDGISGNSIVLVYTSSKLDVSGQLVVNGAIYEHDIALPAQGWYWVQETRIGSNYRLSRVNRAEIDPIIFAF